MSRANAKIIEKNKVCAMMREKRQAKWQICPLACRFSAFWRDEKTRRIFLSFFIWFCYC